VPVWESCAPRCSTRRTSRHIPLRARERGLVSCTFAGWSKPVGREVAVLGLAVLILSGCNSSSTSMSVAPTSPGDNRCAIAATPSPSSFPSAGGVGTVAISTAGECAWSISSEASWILPERTSGQGGATLPFRVAANASPDSRRAVVAIESARLEVMQDGAPCRFELDTTSIEVGAAGGTGRIGISAMAGCSWTAVATVPWISVSQSGPINGTGVVQISIAANSGPARQADVRVAGQDVPVTQSGSTAAPSPAPTPPPSPSPTPGPPSPTPTPSPEPSPTPPVPTPTPPTPPAPTPPKPTPPTPTPPTPPERVELRATVSSVRGGCPNLTFVAGGATVFADESTKYRAGNCKHLEEGQRITVVGQRQSDGRIHAERIDIERHD